MLAAAMGAQGAHAADWTGAGGAIFVGEELSGPADGRVQAPSVALPSHVPAAQQPFADLIAQAASRHGLDPKLLHALVLVESAYQPHAVSPAGAAGLAQLMPRTAAELGVEDRFDPQQSLFGGAAYLAAQLRRFEDVRLALAAFNAGPSRVAAAGQVPQIAETQDYVTRVLECFLALTAGRTVRSSSACPRRGPMPAALELSEGDRHAR